MSPLLGIAAVNSLLFTAYMQAKKLVSPFGELSIAQIAVAGGIAGGANAILASPVEMFKIKMQGASLPLFIDALLFSDGSFASFGDSVLRRSVRWSGRQKVGCSRQADVPGPRFPSGCHAGVQGALHPLCGPSKRSLRSSN